MKKLCVVVSALMCMAALLLAFFLEEGGQMPVSVWVRGLQGQETIAAWEKDGDHVYVFLPSAVAMDDVILKKETQGRVLLEGSLLENETACGGLVPGETYTLACEGWRGLESKMLCFVQAADIPTMFLTTESGSLEKIHARKGNKESGAIRLWGADGKLLYSGEISQLSGRGNYTWQAFEKKPYSLELAGEADLLGLGRASKWVLLANAADGSHMRNKAVLDFARELGLAYTPESAWVNVYANGQYLGLYLLTERNEIHPQRVDIAQDGGFLVSAEVESRLVSQQYPFFRSEMGRALRIHSPENPGSQEIQSFARTWNAVEKAILGEGALEEVMDLDSWAKRYLIDEIFANVDGGYISQYFYYDPQEEKVFAGPVWDFDLSMGSPGEWQLSSPQAFYANWETRGVPGETLWFSELYKNTAFYQRLQEIYRGKCLELMRLLLEEKLNEYAATIADAVRMDDLRWKAGEGDLQAEVGQIRQYMQERTAFLTSVWLEGEAYCVVRAYGGGHTSYAYYAVAQGQPMGSLPVLEDTKTLTFQGWYYEDIDQPYDPAKPVHEDTAVYARWEETPYKKLEQVEKLIPAGLLGMMFLAVLAVSLRRMRKGG